MHGRPNESDHGSDVLLIYALFGKMVAIPTGLVSSLTYEDKLFSGK